MENKKKNIWGIIIQTLITISDRYRDIAGSNQLHVRQ